MEEGWKTEVYSVIKINHTKISKHDCATLLDPNCSEPYYFRG